MSPRLKRAAALALAAAVGGVLALVCTAAISSKVHAETMSPRDCVDRTRQLASYMAAVADRAEAARSLLYRTGDRAQFEATAAATKVDLDALLAERDALVAGPCAHMRAGR